MTNRRELLKKTVKFGMPVLALIYPLFYWLRKVFAQTKKDVLPADFPIGQLMLKDPSSIDSLNIDVTPLEKFGTMGVTNHVVNLKTWRLKVYGKVGFPMEFTLSQIRGLPYVLKKVLLICPGVFSYQGLWKGVDMKVLLNRVKVLKDAKKVTFYGANNKILKEMKEETFSIPDISAGDVFLAYEVNGVPLPRKHGFPLRVVAGKNYGYDWLKYVYEMKVV